MFDSSTPVLRIFTDGKDGPPSQATVLIVEDHADSREILSLLFRRVGYTVLEANDGKEGLRRVAGTHPNLIVTDLGLPEMDGLEFVRRVRAQDGNRDHLKIALLTAYDPKDYLVPALKAGCDLVVGKPIDLNTFDCIVNLLPHHSKSPFSTGNSQVHHGGHINH